MPPEAPFGLAELKHGLNVCHESLSMDVVAKVEWFHNRFTNPYGPDHWPGIIADQSALCTIARRFQAKSVLEIGTWAGHTSLAMWLCSGCLESARALDVCGNFAGGGSEYHCNFDGYGMYFKDTTPIELIKGDSTVYVPGEGERYDMVFIDGNHSYDYVRQDIILAKKLDPKVIAFHDFDNGNGGVDHAISDLGDTLIHHFPNTAVVYIDDFSKIA